jgi:transcriptional regulator with XRE-family HTH domain
MSQDDLARESGLSRRTIGNYERGRAPEGSLGVPDGYFDVARVLGWTPDSIDGILAGGEPRLANITPDTAAIQALVEPVFRIADLARDANAPDELVARFRAAGIDLLTWLNGRTHGGAGRLLGEGVESGDAERILDELESGDDEP